MYGPAHNMTGHFASVSCSMHYLFFEDLIPKEEKKRIDSITKPFSFSSFVVGLWVFLFVWRIFLQFIIFMMMINWWFLVICTIDGDDDEFMIKFRVQKQSKQSIFEIKIYHNDTHKYIMFSLIKSYYKKFWKARMIIL